MAKKKRRLTQHEEFEIFKIVIDKFLWVGVFILLYGFYLMTAGATVNTLRGITMLIAGAVIMIVFMVVMMREYEFIKK